MQDLSDPVVYIHLLGNLSLQRGASLVTESETRARQVWNLLAFLIAHRDRTLRQDDIIGALWPDEALENPANALKNLVYRLRATLTRLHFPAAKDLIVLRHGTYRYNNDLPTEVDADRFERAYQDASALSEDNPAKADTFVQALLLYRSDFLLAAAFESWVVPLRAYYHAMYLKCVYAALNLLFRQRRFADIENVCQNALLIERLDEKIHKYYIFSLFQLGKRDAARAHHSHATELFRRELGVDPSVAMQKLSRAITAPRPHAAPDLLAVKEALDGVCGADCCAYDHFKRVFRASVRAGRPVFLALLSVTDPLGGLPSSRARNEAMELLVLILCRALREDDLISLLGATQCAILLPARTKDDGVAVLSRIYRTFAARCAHLPVTLHSSLPASPPA